MKLDSICGVLRQSRGYVERCISFFGLYVHLCSREVELCPCLVTSSKLTAPPLTRHQHIKDIQRQCES